MRLERSVRLRKKIEYSVAERGKKTKTEGMVATGCRRVELGQQETNDAGASRLRLMRDTDPRIAQREWTKKTGTITACRIYVRARCAALQGIPREKNERLEREDRPGTDRVEEEGAAVPSAGQANVI